VGLFLAQGTHSLPWARGLSPDAGANKGLGFHIARGLAQSGVHTVLTSRNAELGEQAVAGLQAEGYQNVSYHVLDVTDRDSVHEFAK